MIQIIQMDFLTSFLIYLLRLAIRFVFLFFELPTALEFVFDCPAPRLLAWDDPSLAFWQVKEEKNIP